MQHIVSYGIAGGTLCNIVGLVSDRSAEGKEYKGPWVEETTPEELLQCFAGWEPDVQDLLKVSSASPVDRSERLTILLVRLSEEAIEMGHTTSPSPTFLCQ